MNQDTSTEQVTPSPALSRREFLRRMTGLGISAPVAAALLAACGGTPPAAPTTAPATAAPTLAPVPTTSAATAAPAAPTTEAAAPTTEAAAPAAGSTIVLLGHQEVAGMSPDDIGPTVQWAVITLIHNALLELDENYVLQPVLAESYEVAPDGLTYTFKLRQGVKFHDGSELSSADVKYTFEFYGDPANAASIANNFASIAKIEAPDAGTVVMTLKTPNAAFLTNAGQTFIVPAKYHAEAGQEKYRTAPVGTGAFKLKEWKAAESTMLEAFPDHFRGKPKVEFLRLDVVPEASVRAIALETGEAHSTIWPLLVEDNLRFAENPDFKVYRTASVAVNHFPLNNQVPQLADKRVRQAMMYAIDRQRVIDDVFKGTATVATGNLSPALEFWYNPAVPTYSYDVEKAKALLDEAGWIAGADGVREKDGQKLTFVCTVITGDQARRPEAELVQQFFKTVGIDMQLEEAPVASITEGLRKGTMQASLFNWTYGGNSGEPDASTTLRSDGGNNFSQFKNARVDELLDNGLTETDPEKRKAIYNEIQQIVAEEVPFLFMMYWDWFNIFSKNVEGLAESMLNGSQYYNKAHLWGLQG